MKKYQGIIVLGILFFLSGCQKQVSEVSQESVEGSISEEAETTEAVSLHEETEIVEEMSSLTETYSIEEQQDGSAICTYGEIEFMIPPEWKDKYTVIVEGDKLYLYHIATWTPESESKSGLLCGIIRANNVVEEWDRLWPLAYTDEYVYYYESYPLSEYERETEEEFSALKEHESEVKSSIVINTEGVHYDADEYYIPLSSIKEIPDRVLRFMPMRSLQIARNEIYARYGRKFNDPYLREHFETCTWYTPTVEADLFDESVLSEVEKANIEKIKEQEALLAEERAFFQGEEPKEGTFSIEEQADGSAICRFAEITFMIPAEWKGKYVIQAYEDSISFSQKSSKDVDDTSGFLCSIRREDDITDWPETVAIAYTDEHIYYFSRPSDVPCAGSGIPFEMALKIGYEYSDMIGLTEEIKESVVIDAQKLRYDMYEFYFPMSAVKEIADWAVETMDDEGLVIARSEIYARHGCIFKDNDLQAYFMGCSWYTPQVGEDEFDENILSQVEKLNIQKIKDAEGK